MVFFPIMGLQTDPKYYDEPKKFRPERCADSNIGSKSFIEMPYLTFGEGPRNCLGMRLGILQSKIAIILLLRKFKFELADEHKNRELKMNNVSTVLAPANGINLKIYMR